MTLIVEDGSGFSSSNTYGTVAEADDYLSRYEISSNTLTWSSLVDDDKEKYLIQATAELDGMYRLRFKGSKTSSIQALEFPRYGVYNLSGYAVDSNSVPSKIKYAIFEIAKRLSEGTDIRPDLDRAGAIKRKKVGPLETEYFDGAYNQTFFQKINDLIKDFVYDSSKLVRG